MTLYDYLLHKDDEVTVQDTDYYTESYWCWIEPDDRDTWDKAVLEIAKKLKIKEINNDVHFPYVVCNISELIEKHIDELSKQLIEDGDLNDIMYSFDNIIAGYVSEKWMQEFSKILCK